MPRCSPLSYGDGGTTKNPLGPSLEGIINKDCQVAPKRKPLGARLVVNTNNMGGRFVESVKSARWSMSPQEVGDGFESIVEFRSRSKDTMRTNGKDGKNGLMKSSRQN